jgi:hypothetical protein
MAVEPKPGLLGKFKQSDESVKLAVAVGAGVAVGVAGTLALQAYGKKRENDAFRTAIGGELDATPRALAVVRITPQQ